MSVVIPDHAILIANTVSHDCAGSSYVYLDMLKATQHPISCSVHIIMNINPRTYMQYK